MEAETAHMIGEWMYSVLKYYESVALTSMFLTMSMRMGTRPPAFEQSLIF